MTLAPPSPLTRTQTLERARGQGLRILAALPYHYPRALVRAHGFHPMEVWAPASASPDSGPYATGVHKVRAGRHAAPFDGNLVNQRRTGDRGRMLA
ncbi:MAG: hypothetical protein U0R28_09460 [Candidatus Nanopelagicales bacterium]